MMNDDDRAAIDGLFARLDEVSSRGGQRDPQAEAYIRDKIARNPAYAYYLAQTVIVQDQALNAAQDRMADLEAEAQQARAGGGGFFGSLFGSSRPAPRPQPRAMPRPMPPQPGYGQPMPQQGGGFLAGAAQTAMGVAGGVLLGNMLMGMFEGDEAQASEAEEAPAEEDMSFGDEEF